MNHPKRPRLPLIRGSTFRRPADLSSPLFCTLVVILSVALGGSGRGQPTPAKAKPADSKAASPPAGDAEELARREAELARQYVELERSFLRLADLLATTDPRRAAVLRDAFDQARNAETGDRLGRIVTLLEAGQLLKAGASQETAIDQFRGLLALLEEGDGDRGLADTKQQVRQFLTRVTKLIARQRELEGSTEAGADSAELAARQRKAADDAAELAGDLDRFARRADPSPADGEPARPEDAPPPEGEPGQSPDQEPGQEPGQGSERKPGAGERAGEPDKAEGKSQPGGDEAQPPAGESRQSGGEQEGGEQGGDEAADSEPEAGEPPITGDDEASRARRTRRKLQEAEQRMRAARDKLDDAERRGARAEQQKAIEELETARAELEEILRQLREEEVERLLVQLETRIRQMLRVEREVLAAAERLAADAAMSAQEKRIEAVRIGRQQDEVTAEAARALALVRDDGSAVAVPEALGQVHDDCVQAAALLARGDVGTAARGLVTDIVSALEELLAALEKSRRDDEARQQADGAGGRSAEPGEQPLVDKLAELKMLRSLQLRINDRTRRFARLLDEGVERATEPELIEALGRLAERQRAIERAARDIVTGRTE